MEQRKDNFKRKSFDKKNEGRKKFDRKNDGKKSFNKVKDNKKSFDRKPKTEVKVEEKPSNVRKYAYKCMYNIYVNKANSNIEIDHIIRSNNINELDAKLLTNIVYGTLSNEKLLNWEMKKLCDKSPKEQARIIIKIR